MLANQAIENVEVDEDLYQSIEIIREVFDQVRQDELMRNLHRISPEARTPAQEVSQTIQERVLLTIARNLGFMQTDDQARRYGELLEKLYLA